MTKVHKKGKTHFISGDDVLAEQLDKPGVRDGYFHRLAVVEIAEAVRALREQAKLSQADLAARIGTTQSVIARIESGKDRRAPRFETIARVLEALGHGLELVVGPKRKGPLVRLPRGVRPAGTRSAGRAA